MFSYGDEARDLAAKHQMKEDFYDGGFFHLTAFKRIERPGTSLLTVYIEGDGFAWSNSGPSLEPTPKDPVAMNMAVADKSSNVVYLARPCQYTKDWPSRNCNNRYWTSHRFSEDVVRASDNVISQLKNEAEASKIRLVGFSGGGAVAALIAARRSDIESLITVAGTLDHSFWTQHHEVTPLSGSLNPIDYADKLKNVRQIHLSGANDEIVPPVISKHYLKRIGRSQYVFGTTYKGLDHLCCWGDHWPFLLKNARTKLSLE